MKNLFAFTQALLQSSNSGIKLVKNVGKKP